MMCTFNDLCPRGKDKLPVFNHKLNGDSWVPYTGDGNNAWVQLGQSHQICMPHHILSGGIHGRPGWGLSQAAGSHKGPLFCCGKKPFISKEVVNIGYSYGYSWDDSNTACDNNGMKLCNFMSVCPRGPGGRPVDGPVLNQPNDDSWCPLGGEGEDMWVHMSVSHWGLCNRHTEIQNGIHGRPGWGRVRDRGGHHGPMYCCGKPKIKPYHQLATRTTGMTFDQANDVCKSNEMQLCNFMSICKQGHISAPAMGRKDGDVWIPFGGEGDNSWVQIGRAWPQCFRHTEIPGGLSGGPWGRPGWGEDESRHGFKGPIYCCGDKPAPRARIDAGSSKGKTYDEAKAVCERQRKGLCRYTDICPDGHLGDSVLGHINGDVWVPLGGEGPHAWVQVGTGWPTCLRHTEIQGGAHGRPGWSNERRTDNWRGNIYCC